MKDQLKLLEELQRHDARLQELDVQLKVFPERLENMRSDLARVEKMLADEKAKLAEVEKWRAEQERQLKHEEEAILKAKAKLQGVRTSREYMATQREIESTRKMAGERTEEVVKLLEAIESSKKSIASHAEDVEKLRQEVALQEQAIAMQVKDLQAQAATLKVDRDTAAGRVRPDVLKRYNAIRMHRGLAVVPVHNGVCAGCHMAIPPQLYNILQRGNSIELCPQCYRIIYWDKLMEEAPPAPPAPPAHPSPAAHDEEPEAKAASPSGSVGEGSPEHKAAHA